MVTKTVTFGFSALQELLHGVDMLTNAAAVTLGPRGRTVIIEENSGIPRITKDGVTIVRSLSLSNAIQDAGAKFIRTACERMLSETGDGTTTVTVVARSLIHECIKLVVGAEMNPHALKSALELTQQKLLSNLRQQVKTIENKEDLVHVATVSANDDTEIGEMVAEAIEFSGKNGFVTAEAGKTTKITLESTKGIRFEQGYISNYFVTNAEKNIALLESPLIVLYGDKLSDSHTLLPLLEKVQKLNRPLLLIADDITADALALLVLNAQRGTLKVAAVKSPSYGEARIELMEDIAALTGALFIQPSLGNAVDQITEDMMGSAEKVTISLTETILSGGRGEPTYITERCEQIKVAIEYADAPQQRESLQKRLATLSGGMSVIRVGGLTEIEIREKLDRTEDALRATRAAQEEGIVAGGGVALLRAAQMLDEACASAPEMKAAIKIIKHAAEAPLRQIAENSGISGSIVLGKILDNSDPYFGFNARTRDYCDLMEQGIIDPLKVIRIGIQQAVSVATLLMSAEVTVTEKQELMSTN